MVKDVSTFMQNAQRDIHEKLIPFFEKHPLQSQKAKSFEIFREIAKMVQRKEHKTHEGFEKVLVLKKQMNAKTRRVREIRTPGGNATQLPTIAIRPSSHLS